MRPNEIVKGEVKGNSRFEILKLLAECVSQASQSAHVKASDAVQSLDVACADQIHIRVSGNLALLAERDRRCAITSFLMMLALIRSVILNNHSIVSIHSESLFNRIGVHAQTVS